MGNSNEMARAMAAGLHAPQFASMAQAAQGLVGGINAGIAQVDKRNKDMQRYEANQYVSGLLGEATPENYEANLMKAASMSPYASPEMMRQADTARALFQRKEDLARQDKRYAREDFVSDRSFGLQSDQFDFTKDSWYKDFGFKTEKDARDYAYMVKKDRADLQAKYDLARMSAYESELNRQAQYGSAMMKPEKLVVIQNGKESVITRPAYMIPELQKQYGGKNVMLHSDYIDTKKITGQQSTDDAMDKYFNGLISNPDAMNKEVYDKLSAYSKGHNWFGPDIKHLDSEKFTARISNAMANDPAFRKAYSAATTPAGKGEVIAKFVGYQKPDLGSASGILKRIGGNAVSFLPEEWQPDTYKMNLTERASYNNK